MSGMTDREAMKIISMNVARHQDRSPLAEALKHIATRLLGEAAPEGRAVALPEDVMDRCRDYTIEQLLDCAMQVHARSVMYGTKAQHEAAQAYRDEIVRRFNAAPAPVAGDAVRNALDLLAGAKHEIPCVRAAVGELEAALAQDRASPKCHASPTGKHQSAEDEPALSERWCQWCSEEFSADAQDRASQAVDTSTNEAWIARAEAKLAAPVAVEDGWRLVPIVPTDAMETAHAMYGDTSDWWNAVIDAAPTPAAEREVGRG